MDAFNIADLRYFLPEIYLTGGILALVLGDILVKTPEKKRTYLTGLAVLAVVGSGVLAFSLGDTNIAIFSGQIAIDPVSTLFKVVFVFVTTVAIFTSLLSKELPDKSMGEYYALLLCICLGMFLMASANDLLMVFLGTEMVSIVSYAMAGYRLRDKRSSEAALKYVVYGGAASAMMLFGMSLFYGLLGTTELTSLYYALNTWSGEFFRSTVEAGRTFPLALLLSIVLMFAGIGFKIAVVPFHMWSPDVYEGAPTSFSGFLSVGPKAAGFAILMRVFIGALVPTGDLGAEGARGFLADADGMMAFAVDLPLPAMIGIVAAATMTFGNLAAIPQNNVKRLLAYSSIAHAGYILMGFVVLSESSLHAVIFYLVVYYLMNIGAFTVCQAVRDKTGGELLHDFRGLGMREPLLAIFMTIFLLSLTGLPPLAGFIGKFYLFASVIQKGGFWFYILAIVGVLNSAVSLYYYLRVVKAMYFTSAKEDEPLGVHRGYVAITGLLAVPTLVFGLYWTPLRTNIVDSLAFYRSPAPPTAAATLTTPPADDTP